MPSIPSLAMNLSDYTWRYITSVTEPELKTNEQISRRHCGIFHLRRNWKSESTLHVNNFNLNRTDLHQKIKKYEQRLSCNVCIAVFPLTVQWPHSYTIPQINISLIPLSDGGVSCTWTRAVLRAHVLTCKDVLVVQVNYLDNVGQNTNSSCEVSVLTEAVRLQTPPGQLGHASSHAMLSHLTFHFILPGNIHYTNFFFLRFTNFDYELHRF